MQTSDDDISHTIEQLYRRSSRHIFATLVRLLGDFDLAEEALHEAFRTAIEKWPTQGIPTNPQAWLVSAGRFKAIDGIRRNQRFSAWDDNAQFAENVADETPNWDALQEQIALEDDRLRLVFTCCHPSLAFDAQVALTLREVCGLTTEEIASAFLIPAPTLAQRIVRAKSKIRDARIPYHVPDAAQLPERINSVLRVIYLVFNEGYSASNGDLLTRSELSNEAIRLARLLRELLPDQAEIMGLLALMLLHESRRAARVKTARDLHAGAQHSELSSAQHELIPLDEQDRSLWNAEQIAEGCALAEQALRTRQFGVYSLQAAISAVHAEAESSAATDWTQIVGLYDALFRLEPTAIVALNHPVAIAMREGPTVGLHLVTALLQEESLQKYHLAHAAQADMYRRLARYQEARLAYEQALALCKQGAEQRFLQKRIAEMLELMGKF
ncbi:RNA polymerase sigma factor [Undibacterium danionis]|uniref:RNA polymerase sigma factor n=1 Tax=Undibacterium danionis TaxID=1812100 RepID=A0ABV6IE59_9BURK